MIPEHDWPCVQWDSDHSQDGALFCVQSYRLPAVASTQHWSQVKFQGLLKLCYLLTGWMAGAMA